MTETVTKPPTALTMCYDRVTNPLEFVHNIGTAISESRMFGCANVSQGRVLALACLTERKTPLEILRKYHLLGGRLTMKADAMLADFKTLAGGSHRIVCRTPEKAAVELKLGMQKNLFEFTWQEAQVEDYVYTKDANDGKVPKKLPSGELNPKALKDNWSTPRRRMQMLWARCVSDAVRATAPEVNAGTYTPEEFGASDVQEEAGEVLDAEFTVVAAVPPASPLAGDPLAEPAPFATTFVTPPAPVIDQMLKSPVSAAPVAGDPVHRQEMLAEIKGLKDAMQIPADAWKQVLDNNYGAASALQLDDAQLASLLNKLREKKRKLEVAAGTDPLSQWANQALQGGKAGPST